MIIQVSGAMLVGSISFVPMIHCPVITIDAQDADGKKVVLHLVEEDGDMTKEEREDYYADRCYECTGYGDDWYIDGNGELVRACDECPYSKEFEKNDQTGSGRGA